jgi:hypothetical protein
VLVVHRPQAVRELLLLALLLLLLLLLLTLLLLVVRSCHTPRVAAAVRLCTCTYTQHRTKRGSLTGWQGRGGVHRPLLLMRPAGPRGQVPTFLIIRPDCHAPIDESILITVLRSRLRARGLLRWASDVALHPPPQLLHGGLLLLLGGGGAIGWLLCGCAA